ncbi:MAG: OmpA family protein [Muribaculaceae bacterium]|nr:OmpA family protein [Muribaculaceae bacterium]
MKAKKLVGLMALCAAGLAFPSGASAQQVVEEAVSVTEFTCDPSTKYFSNWRDNWFIQIGAGINQPFVERGIGMRDPGHYVNRKKMTTVYNFGFGRWFSPYLAVRINALGGAVHWNCPTVAEPNNGWTRGKHANLNVDIMWDMLNSICGPNPNRAFSIIPYAGIGGDCMWDIRDSEGGLPPATNIYRDNGGGKRKTSWTLPVSAGIQFRLRLCKYVDFFAEARANFYGDNWNNVADGKSVDALVSCYGGFSFNIGGRGWNSYNECAYLSQIASLNNDVNALRAELLNSAQAISALEAQLPCPEAKTVTVVNTPNANPLLATVRFTIDSDVITPEEEVNIFNVAEWLKANPSKIVNVVGYADKDTGTPEYNMALSQRRADAVANELITKYGIAKDRIKVKADGSDVQPYKENDWNRIVICTE